MADSLQDDISSVGRIAAVPTILEVVCRSTGMGFAAVARVTEDRWIACGVRDEIDFGLRPGGELKVETTICHEIRTAGEAVIINNVSEDALYRGHPTPAMYGFQSYISVPIVLSGGRFFGTLCAIDPRPALLNTPETIGMFKLFAELIAFHIDAHERLLSSEATLLSERRTAELREQFIAVLGHDLRNPLASIDAGTKLLLRTPLPSQATAILGLIQNSVARMSGLIDDVLDFARGRLGGGLTIEREATQSLEPILRQVVAELGSSSPDRQIEARFELAEPVDCNRDRIAQLLSNLLGNALSYGAAEQPVRVRATAAEGVFELAVANAGDPIPPAAMERLFQPFSRGAVRPSQRGLGLGLYISSQIAQAHGGVLDVTSTAAETRFSFRMNY
jgi:signal transduction histidine kinase